MFIHDISVLHAPKNTTSALIPRSVAKRLKAFSRQCRTEVVVLVAFSISFQWGDLRLADHSRYASSLVNIIDDVGAPLNYDACYLGLFRTF